VANPVLIMGWFAILYLIWELVVENHQVESLVVHTP
jgi:hypothetical protein